VLDVLSTFARDQQFQTLSEIARRAELPLSTAHRIVGELAERGVLERGVDGAWHVGLPLWEMASGCPRTQIVRDVALPFMQDLYEVTHENVHLAVRDGSESVFVERIAGHRSVELVTRVGGRLPLAATGLGRVLLAHAPTDVVESVLDSPLQAWTPHTLVDPEQLRAQLAQIRRDHVIVCDRQIQTSTISVAAPIRMGAGGPVRAALAVIIPAEQAQDARGMRGPLLRTVQAIAAEFGRRAHE
jgi:DNA-binding IclR family transcriptional regulator